MKCPHCGKEISNKLVGDLIVQSEEEVILSSLREGEKQWSDLEKEVGVSKVTLNKRLKKLIQQEYVIREVRPSFPPQTFYRLNENKKLADINRIFPVKDNG